MTKDEMRELLRTCKAIYSRFEGAEKVDGQIRILNEVVDAWHVRSSSRISSFVIRSPHSHRSG